MESNNYMICLVIFYIILLIYIYVYWNDINNNLLKYLSILYTVYEYYQKYQVCYLNFITSENIWKTRWFYLNHGFI